jgi:hypothetical protein
MSFYNTVEAAVIPPSPKVFNLHSTTDAEVHHLSKLLCEAIVNNDEDTIELAVSFLRNTKNTTALITFAKSNGVAEAGIKVNILLNPCMPKSAALRPGAKRTAISSIPTNLSEEVKGSNLYACFVADTGDIAYIHASGVDRKYAVLWGYCDSEDGKAFATSDYHYTKNDTLFCIPNASCSDELCEQIVDVIARQLCCDDQLMIKMLAELARHRPEVHKHIADVYMRRDYSGEEIAAFTDVSYIDFQHITYYNAAYIFTYTSLVKVVEYLLTNFDMLYLCAGANHKGLYVPETRRVGYLKYLLLREPEKILYITEDDTIVEIELLLQFPHSVISSITDSELAKGTWEILMKVWRCGYHINSLDIANSKHTVKSIRLEQQLKACESEVGG